MVPGAEWLGAVPSCWAVTPLFTVLRETNQRNSGLRERNLLSLSYGRIVRKDIDTLEGLLPESFETYQVVESGDIVLRLTDLQNDQRSLRVGLVSERGIITSAYVNLRTGGNHDPRFLFYQLHNADLRKVFYNFGGGVRQSMKYADLKRLPIILPPSDEQRAIADFLDRETQTVDELVEAKRDLILALKDRRESVITHQAYGQDWKGSRKESGSRCMPTVPTHWDVLAFRRCVTISEGQVDPEDDAYKDIVLVAPNHVESGTGRILFTETAQQQGAISGKYRVRAGDLIYSKIRPALNKVCLADFDCLCSADMYALSPRTGMRADYLFYLMLSGPFVQLVTDESMRVAMPKVNRPTLLSILIPRPPTLEQQQIATFLRGEVLRLETLAQETRKSIEKLSEYRSSLISAAVTGQIDVRTYRPQEAAALCL
jgi:type I restriction enzyme S subunit